ncbi:MAG: hypothetical protein RI983_1335 [Bacteroidota bacterium]|jgi:hypothetical protein
MQDIRKNIPLLLMIISLAGLYFSRAVLSIATGLWFLYGMFELIRQKEKIHKQPLLLWSIAFPLLCLLGSWQSSWVHLQNQQILLTAFAYPAWALGLLAIKDPQQWKRIRVAWVIGAIIGLCYPLIAFVGDMQGNIQSLGSGKALPVFMDTDHVRFGILLVSAVTVNWILMKEDPANKWLKISLFFLIAGVLFTAIRTAWVLLFTLFMGWILLESKKKMIALFLLIIVGAISYQIPTVKNKIHYTLYDFEQYNQNGYNPNYSDGVRRAINQVSWKAIQEKGFSNMGWAVIPDRLQEEFKNSTQGSETNFGWPFNQWLFWWMGVGFGGMLLFTLWLCYPLLYAWRKTNASIAIWTLAIAASCLVECTINYQYGTLLHIVPLLLLQKNYLTST